MKRNHYKPISWLLASSLLIGSAALTAQNACQVGVLDLTANGGINPNTGNPWQLGDKYRLAFHTLGTTTTTSNDPNYYNDFATTQAWQVAALQGTYWRAMVTVNLDPTTTQALSPKSHVRDNTGTGILTGFAQGGAGEPVYVVNGTTCIARNNADIWNAWSNPFEASAGVADPTGNGNNVVRWLAGTGPTPASQNVHYSPFLDQNGNQTVNPDTVHGKDIATGCNVDGNHVNALGNTTDVININGGNTNANNTTRPWNRWTTNTTESRSLYAISVPLTIVDLSETVAPTLVSIADNVSGGPVVVTKLSTPTYLVTFDEAIKPSSIGTDDFENGGTAGVTINSVSPTGDPAVFQVVVTTSSVGTLVLQIASGAVIEDLAGNPMDTAAPLPDDTTITVNPLPELAGQLGVLDVVNANGGINPATGLAWAAGDTYRLVFITSQTTDAQSADIATYNAFVQGVAAASTTYPDLGNGQWKIIGSTVAVDARDNTGTNPNTDGTGVPIFLADGVRKVADDNADLWNGNIDTAIDIDENGQSFVIPNLFSGGVFTGSFADGTSVGDSGGDVALGVDTTPAEVSGVQTGTNFINNLDPPIPATGGQWMRVWKAVWTEQRSAYAMCGVLTVQSTASGTPYATWAADNAPSGGPNDDFDGDGVANAVEFVLGGLATTNDLANPPTVATSGGNMTFTFVRDQASVDPSVSVVIEVGTDLSTWPDVYTVGAITGGGVTVTDNANGTDTITLTVTQAPDTKKFARLKVVIAP